MSVYILYNRKIFEKKEGVKSSQPELQNQTRKKKGKKKKGKKDQHFLLIFRAVWRSHTTTTLTST